jgi:hypothetical protein
LLRALPQEGFGVFAADQRPAADLDHAEAAGLSQLVSVGVRHAVEMAELFDAVPRFSSGLNVGICGGIWLPRDEIASY